MYASKMALLSRDPKRLRALTEAAKNAGLTVDAIVRAGLGRSSPHSAIAVAQELQSADPEMFDALTRWPQDCHVCCTAAAGVPCNICGKVVCEQCLTSRGCVACANTQAERVKYYRDQRLQRAATIAAEFG